MLLFWLVSLANLTLFIKTNQNILEKNKMHVYTHREEYKVGKSNFLFNYFFGITISLLSEKYFFNLISARKLRYYQY